MITKLEYIFCTIVIILFNPVHIIKLFILRDIGGIFGLLKGGLVHSYLKKHLPVHLLEQCRIPCGTTAFDLFRLKTTIMSSGCLPTAMLASCTFPGLFQPVIINSTPHIDG
jgi:predicted acylesterase/phospholipase RssA